ncbi:MULTISPECIES: GNAT family N-acetyltransferase [Asaia]|uniref:GNAT family N-acetyltransferase n=1 Tax=Asaia TaxID=91914 RepID=UPI002FC2D7A0
MIALIDNRSLNRFELTENGVTGFVAYHREEGENGEILVLDHTEVPPALSGKGTGTRLVCAVLDKALSENWKIDVRCAFIRHVIDRHPVYKALLSR